MPVKMGSPKGNGLIPAVKTFIMWALSCFMFVSGLVYFPSLVSVFMFLFTAIVAPFDKVQDFWRRFKISGAVKVIILIALFIACIIFVPVRQA